ncbi:MAG TPA: DUF5719 family protein [Actinomycetota bacterium]|nr:DUF5719 family protein [Actinomycetota bacterium]
MRARGQVLAALLVLGLVLVGGAVLERTVGPHALAAGPPGAAPSGAWLCPHGGGVDWTVTLHVANPGDRPVRVRVTDLSAGAPGRPRSFTVPPGSDLALPEPAPERESSSYIEYFGGWVAAGWVAHAGGGEVGVAAEPCLARPATRWLLADGTTRQHEDAYVIVMNPFAADAVFTITLLTDRGTPITTEDWTNVRLRPERSAAFRLNAKALGYATVSAILEVKVGRVAASSLGVSEPGGVRSSVGVPGTGWTRTILPGGFDQGRTELVAMSSGDRAARFSGRELLSGASQAVAVLQDGGPELHASQTFPVSTQGPSAIVVDTPPGTAVARRTYGLTADTAATSGAPAAASAWVVLPSAAGRPAHPGLVLANPGDTTATVTLSYLPSGPSPPAPPPVTIRVPPGRTVAAPKAFVQAKPFSAMLAVATEGTFVPASASYSLGQKGFASFAVSVGVRIPDPWIPS